MISHMTDLKEIFLKRDELLSPHATRSYSGTRAVEEDESPIRTPFQRDRDRIIHTKAFRRLKRKSQVLIAPEGEHYTTRMTHVQEVSQVGRTIARALCLNEDLVEAAALGHDLGHTPFGHTGEEVLNEILPDGFHHSGHSVRVVTELERDGKGLNLTDAVIEAIARHSKPRGEFNTQKSVEGMSLEAQIVRISDAIAYLAHDVADGLRCAAFKETDLPLISRRVIGEKHSARLNSMVSDIVRSSRDCGDGSVARPWIRMSDEMKEAVDELRGFMFKNFYLKVSGGKEGRQAKKITRLIHDHLSANPDVIPDGFRYLNGSPNPQAVTDYLAGMTDNYAMFFAEQLQPGVSKEMGRQFS